MAAHAPALKHPSIDLDHGLRECTEKKCVRREFFQFTVYLIFSDLIYIFRYISIFTKISSSFGRSRYSFTSLYRLSFFEDSPFSVYAIRQCSIIPENDWIEFIERATNR